ncbi:DUF7827 domain-containing protein [Halobellus ruber]|uniref:PGF-CTERM sorting domain-containing protein n=1 Tax=Halobellus ruber TaxID=2761102 RepID=A0A7J9SD71_9EURY|nr:BGTF surface domain-containing protein [Halobellus ruber]MBB6644708.1 PGF-CTERM sorting domain-containing protein [Halobellus ruber]
MTGNTKKVRAVFLAALMIFSVFAGTVAFSGSVAAEEPTYGGNAVHYVNESGGGDPVVEVPFEGNVEAASLDRDNFTILDDGDNTSSIQNFRQRNATVILTLDRAYPSNDLEVSLSENIQSPGGDTITNDGDKTVVFAGQTLEYEGDANGGGTDVQANTATNVTAYQGVTIAINVSKYNNISRTKAAGGDVPVTVEGEDNTYFQEGSTGVNSSVYTFNTGDRELGEYRVFINNSDNQANRAFINVRDLQLDIEADDLNVSTDDTIETTVSAVAGSRDIEAELLDNTGDSINTTQATLDGQGEADIDFNAGSADDGDTLDPGTYTVEVTDNATGVTVESSEITVSEAEDEDVSFVSTTITDQRGDILEATIEMTETSEATVTFGSKDDGVIANATFEDDNGDDQVTFYVNTYNFEDDQANVFALDSDSDDVLLDQTQNNNPANGPSADGLGELLDAGDYDLEAEAGDQGVTTGVTQSDDIATVTLEDRSTENIRMWTGSKEAIGSVSDLEDVNEAIEEGQITQSSEVAVGDFAVHQLEASGFEGALNAREDEDVSQAFSTLNATGPINLTIEEASPGANQDARELDLDYTGSNANVTVIADGPNDTYFVIVDTASVNYKNGDTLPSDSDTALETNFTVLNRDSPFGQDFVPEDDFDDDENSETLVTFNANEPEVTIQEPFNVSQASGQTISATTNIAPGTEVRLRVRSDDGVSPSFLKTATPVVGSDGSFGATFDFSGQNVGDTYEITVSSTGIILASDETEDGTVVEAVATDTATPEPDTDTPEPDTDTPTPEPDTDTATPEPDTDTPMPDTDTPTSTPTSTPGFGVVVALTALLAAALLAIRRD